MTPTVKIILGDCLERLQELPEESVQCCVTSPPYWGLRDYGVAGQIGLEKTPEEYVEKMVQVFREVRRVLRKDGTCWVNLGDSYAGSGKGPAGNLGATHDERNLWKVNGGSASGNVPDGLKPKDIVGIPWRVAFALQADGWWLRQDIIWHKPNPMPESVTDRCTKAHEYIFLLTKNARYFYDAEAVKEPQSQGTHERFGKNPEVTHKQKTMPNGSGVKNNPSFNTAMRSMVLENGRNKRSVWTVPSAAYSEAHFATFPPDLIKPCILAGTSARGCCPTCGAPWVRVVERSGGSIGHSWHDHSEDLTQGQRVTDPTAKGSIARCKDGNGKEYRVETKGWEPGCDCGYGKLVPCTVLDPFGGSGTTGMVALELGRKAILIELNPAYMKFANDRTNVTAGLAL
jgi:DNA modification methylase